MYFSVITLVLLIWTTSVQSRPAFSSADSHSQVNQNISLTSNITLQGDICPVGVQLNCFVPDQPSLTWFFENNTVETFTPKDYHRYPYDLCEHHLGEHPLLREICTYHGKLFINNATQSERDKDLYSISSTFELRTYFLNDNRGDQYSFVACGSNEHMETLQTNFTVNCSNPATPEVEIASTSTDHELCSAGTEVTCNGTDFPSLTWSSNAGQLLIEPYVYNIIHISRFPLELSTTIPGVKIRVDGASRSNDYSSQFSFNSTLIFTESFHNVDYVSCGSAQKTEKVHFHCAASECEGVQKLLQSFRDFCFINDTVPCSEVRGNIKPVCYVLAAISGLIIAAPIIYVSMGLCIALVCYCCSKKDYSRLHDDDQTDIDLTAETIPVQNFTGKARINPNSPDGDRRKKEDKGRRKKKEEDRSKNEEDRRKKDEEDRRRKQDEKDRKKEEEERIRARTEQEENEREKAYRLLQDFLSKNETYRGMSLLPDIGSRLQKYYCVSYSSQTSSGVLLTIAPLPKNCSLTELESDLDAINRSILPTLIEHPHIHKVHRIYDAGDSSNQVIVVQAIAQHGSLRDKLSKNKYNMDWSEKYKERKVLKSDEIAKYGGQILEALLFLYAQGFPPLGHIHTGNIFITDHGCTLAGYDNTLLGYRSSFHRLFGKDLDQNLLESIDVIMFGRVVFEMSSKTDLMQLLPDETDLATVTNPDIRDLLRLIFEVDEEGKLKNSIKMISKMPFFAKYFRPPVVTEPLTDDPHMRRVLTQKHDCKVKTKEQIEAKLDRVVGRIKQLEGSDVQPLPIIGQRQGKYWKKAETGEGGGGNESEGKIEELISLAKVSETCPVVLLQSTVATINSLLEKCAKCDLLQRCKLHFDSESCYVVFIQPLRKKSLQDVLFKIEDPLVDWLEKTKTAGGYLTEDKVALFSSQILKAVQVLYNAGFPALGHITTGNIFLVDVNTCVLGGYENTLLGYPSRFNYGEQYKEFIDMIMFGHVVYEMSTGHKLQGMTPSDEEYRQVRYKDVRTFLTFVFERDGETFTHSIEDIFQQKFIRKGLPDTVIITTDETRNLLQKMRKDKVRDNTAFGRFRYGAKTKLKKVYETVTMKVKQK